MDSLWFFMSNYFIHVRHGWTSDMVLTCHGVVAGSHPSFVPGRSAALTTRRAPSRKSFEFEARVGCGPGVLQNSQIPLK